MAERDDFLSRINEHFSHLSKGQKLIASYVIDHYDQAVFMTAAEIADELVKLLPVREEGASENADAEDESVCLPVGGGDVREDH